MKFHGITMVGAFINQKIDSLPVFDPGRDQGRMVWLTDGSLFYGSDIEWVGFGDEGDASAVEDLYSDLLRTTIFLNASYDEFGNIPENDDLIDSTDMVYTQKTKIYTYTAGQHIQSTNLYDPITDMAFIDYILPSANFYGTVPPTIEVTSDGVNWFVVGNNVLLRMPTESAGTDLRMR